MSQIIFMVALFILALVRALYMRRHAMASSPYESCNTVGGWYILAPLLALPLFHDIAVSAYELLIEMPYLIVIGLLKGVGFWGMIYSGQIMRRTSNSSAGFFGFICIGLIAVGNSIFGEDLTMPQWVSVVCLFLMGLYFYSRGHLSTQSSFVKLLFMFQILIGVMFGMIDHYFLTHCNWYALVVLTGLGMVLMAVSFGRMKISQVLKSVKSPKTAGLGIVLSLIEMTVLSIFVTHLPVTLGWVAMTLASVAVMVIAAVFWGEGRWQQQLTVGSFTYASALPIILT